MTFQFQLFQSLIINHVLGLAFSFGRAEKWNIACERHAGHEFGQLCWQNLGETGHLFKIAVAAKPSEETTLYVAVWLLESFASVAWSCPDCKCVAESPLPRPFELLICNLRLEGLFRVQQTKLTKASKRLFSLDHTRFEP